MRGRFAPLPAGFKLAWIEVKGHNGTVRLDDGVVTITRKGFFARAKGEKRIPIRDLGAVQLKPAGPVANGCIQFTIAGGIEESSHLGREMTQTAENENSVIFTQGQAGGFEALRDAAEEAIAASRPGQNDASASAVVSDRISMAGFGRSGTDRRSGNDRRQGTERRGPQSPIVERVGLAMERRANDGDRRAQERRSGDDRRFFSSA